MCEKYWLSDPNFKMLCDIVVKNNLVCITGAGISTNLQLEKGTGTAPRWDDLLSRICFEIKAKAKDHASMDGRMVLSEAEIQDIDSLLYKYAPGEQLIEVASILCKKDRELFKRVLVESVKLKAGETSETHKELLNLLPRGIITYNYDEAHENALEKAGSKNWEVLLPGDSDQIINLLRNNFKSPFLLKAHGTVTDEDTLVLTGESYRDLFNKYPYYKSFVQNIVTNYQLLIVGFGLSDPDFDTIMQEMFSTYGSAIQNHVVIRSEKQKTAKDTLYKRKYGLNFLYVKDFAHIPEILRDCRTESGNILDSIINDCISKEIKVRGKAHSIVRSLSAVGKANLANILMKKIKENIKNEGEPEYCSNTENSEYVYTLGIIIRENKEYQKFLINKVIEKSVYAETVAHALIFVKDVLKEKDLPMVEGWIEKFSDPSVFKEDVKNPDPDNRVLIYCKYVRALVRAKYRVF